MKGVLCNFARIPRAVHGDEWLPLQGLGVDAPPCGRGYSLNAGGGIEDRL